MTGKIDKGRSILNAMDETANPYGLVLSEEERNFIYGQLNRLDNTTNSLYAARTGWRPQLKATVVAAAEFVIVAAVIVLPAPSRLKISSFFFAVTFLILQKLNLLLTHERIDENFARREREDKREATERARYFRNIGSKDMGSEGMN